MPLPQLSTAWLEANAGTFSPGSVSYYRLLLKNHILPAFGERTDISAEEIQAFAETKRAEGTTPRTVSAMVTLLRRILSFGAGRGECPAPDRPEEPRKSRTKAAVVLLSPEQEQRLREYLVANPTPMHLCLFLILTTGMSVNEVLRVKWERVSLQRNYIRIPKAGDGHTGRSSGARKITLGAPQRAYLRKLQAGPACYLASGTEKPRLSTAVAARWRIVEEELGLPVMDSSDLRHNYILRRLEEGASVRELNDELGTTTPSYYKKFYGPYLSPATRQRLEGEAERNRHAPNPKPGPEEKDAQELARLQRKRDERKAELKAEIDALEGDLAIIRSLRYSDCVQGANRQGLYAFIEKVLGDDKDGQYLVEYLRCNMRVADMPLLKETTVQSIRHRVTHGFEKLNRRLDEIYAVEGYDILGLFQALCDAVIAAAPPEPRKPGRKALPTLENRYKEALKALGRIKEKE